MRHSLCLCEVGCVSSRYHRTCCWDVIGDTGGPRCRTLDSVSSRVVPDNWAVCRSNHTGRRAFGDRCSRYTAQTEASNWYRSQYDPYRSSSMHLYLIGPQSSLLLRTLYLVVGVILTERHGVYISADLGEGPRDCLRWGTSSRWSIRAIWTAMEILAPDWCRLGNRHDRCCALDGVHHPSDDGVISNYTRGEGVLRRSNEST